MREGKEDEQEVRVSDSVRHAQARGLARRIQSAAELRTRHRAWCYTEIYHKVRTVSYTHLTLPTICSV